MINNIDIKNFKSLMSNSFELKKLNVLSGINGAGKSTLCQAILLLKEYFEHYASTSNTVSLNGNFLNLGTVQDILNEGAQDDLIDISYQVGEANYKFILDASTELRRNDFANLKNAIVDHASQSNIFSKVKYLAAERLGPRVVQNKNDYSLRVLKDLGVAGQYVNSFLELYGKDAIQLDNRFHLNSESDQLIHQVELWLKEISPNINLNTNSLLNTDFVSIQYQFATKLGRSESYRATNVGFGISYILPVIVMCLSSSPGDILIIDTPEAHLHPRGQSKIGELLANTAADGVQVILETHSDHVINGIRRQAAKRKLLADDTSFYFFTLAAGEEITSPYSKIYSPKLDQNGMFDKWPDGFFDEWSASLSELIKLRN
ncbi:DUF3696 domain-containing protein [Cedecea davisae]|uniref:DUF3696 domain-containing protein n=1 Tax=Cedecea davisae TaxID=158484 RepID=A0ABS6DIE7_9ENTR|nr:DUF3696 domain-containing protein [Cedecea davisae]MBU4682937.1 DUF3696 domain-containing protein [Cedecea davisae]MBU4687964.1 DUF3696 domain-containing protein [Cedecea davisae]